VMPIDVSYYMRRRASLDQHIKKHNVHRFKESTVRKIVLKPVSSVPKYTVSNTVDSDDGPATILNVF
jgi:hypothetical protein